LAFAAIPNVKPTTDIVLFAGYALGAAPGFAVGAVTAIASNVFLSQGPWTAWQMAGWGAVGVGGAVLARLLRGRDPGRLVLAVACLRRAQNRAGGFGAVRGQSSGRLYSGWSALGLAAAHRNPRDVRRRNGRSVAGYIRRHSGSLGDVGELERTILVLRAAG